MLVLPERTSVVPLSPEQDSSGTVTHPCPSTLQRDGRWLLLLV